MPRPANKDIELLRSLGYDLDACLKEEFIDTPPDHIFISELVEKSNFDPSAEIAKES